MLDWRDRTEDTSDVVLRPVRQFVAAIRLPTAVKNMLIRPKHSGPIPLARETSSLRPLPQQQQLSVFFSITKNGSIANSPAISINALAASTL